MACARAVWLLALLLLLAAGAAGGRRRQGSSRAAPRPRPQAPRAPPPPPPRCPADATRPDAAAALEAKARDAPFVFTGKVVRAEPLGGGRPLTALTVDADGVDADARGKSFEVRLKRALKGEFPWSLLEVRLAQPHLHRSVEVVAPPPPAGAPPPRCRHVLRVNHTAIFLARRDPDAPHFRLLLAANPLALTLRNLDKLNAAVKDIPYKPVPPIIEEPCEKQYCAYGANCVTDDAGRARCQCPADCPDVFAPVCGSDGVTYDNHCLLRQKACRDQASVRVQHSGECGAGRSVSGRRG